MKQRYCKFIRSICFVIAIFFVFVYSVPVIISYATDDSLQDETEYNNDISSQDSLELPSSADIRTGNTYFPRLRKQGPYSCRAWVDVYYQFTYEVAKLRNVDAANNDNYVFSPDYVYNYLCYTHGAPSNGLSAQDCYNFLNKQGSVTYTAFSDEDDEPYSWYSGSTPSETTEMLHNALKFRAAGVTIGNLSTVTNGTYVTSNTDSDLVAMKRLLVSTETSSAHPLAIATPTSNYKRYCNGKLVVLRSITSETSHAMIVVGYDDNVWCDLNENNIEDEEEYGAFLVVDPFNNLSETDGREYWVAYDALNGVSASSSGTNTNRSPYIIGNAYRYITVGQFEPELTVEVTVQQKVRNGFSVSLERSDSETSAPATVKTFVDGIGGDRGFDGTLNPTSYQSYTFVFDYDAYGMYEGSGYHYWVQVQDLQANDSNNTIVSKIVWKDKNGNIVYQITPSDTLDGAGKRYCMALEKIEINKTSQRIQKGDTDTLVVTGAPADVVVSTSWHSDNPGCVTVSDGNITAVGIGTATVTATVQFESGVELYAECEYTVVEGYGASANEATVVSLYDVKNGELARTGDVSWFKFTPTTTGRYLLYSVGGTSLVADMYTNTFDEVFESGIPSADNNDFVISKKLNAGQTYYIKLSGANDCCGAYTFCVANGEVASLVLPENGNQDARHVRISVSAASLYDTLKLSIGNSDFFFTRGNTSTLQGEVSGARFKITFVDTVELLTTEWNIDIDISLIPSLVGEAKTVKALFTTVGAGSGDTSPQPTLLAYESAFLAGVQVEETNNLQLLLNGITETGYTYTVYGVDGNVITDTTTGLAATGMKIVKKDAQNRIVKVYHVVVIGDVQGDGCVDNIDASWILKYDAGTGTLTEISLVSADVNQDGAVDNIDSAVVLNYDNGLVDIDQQLNETVVPVGIYFGQPIGF